jgi:hypothetical protein
VKDGLVNTSSDWPEIENPSTDNTPMVNHDYQNRNQHFFESTQTKFTNASICEEGSAMIIQCLDRWEEIGRWPLRSYSILHVRLTMMPHFINVLHQNCHRQQMTSVRIINHHNSECTGSSPQKAPNFQSREGVRQSVTSR